MSDYGITVGSSDGTLRADVHGDRVTLYRRHPEHPNWSPETMYISLHAFREVASRLFVNEPWMKIAPGGIEHEVEVNGFLALVAHELRRARQKHPQPLNSHHEAYAVVKEELEEAWAEVKQQLGNANLILKEIVQVAAMCMRWAEDVCAKEQASEPRWRETREPESRVTTLEPDKEGE